MDFWNTDGLELKKALREPSGRRFTGFVDAILQAECHIGNVPQAAIHTDQQNNVADGGVDTKIDVAVPNDATGWLSDKSIWQYKADDGLPSQAALKKEVEKDFSKDCIKQGFAYRYCICDNITADKVADKEKELVAIVQAINPNAPAPKIVTADQLASVANSLPTIILQYLRPLTGEAFHVSAWGNIATTTTATYVDNPGWEPTITRLTDHFNFTIVPADVVLPIQGDAGVGKTRLVYEVVSKAKGLVGLAIYVLDDQRAIEIATMIANHSTLRAVLIVDECPLQTRMRLYTILQGCRGRVRVVTIDNSGERSSSSTAVEQLQQLPDAVVQAILRINFPGVPEDHRREYARLTGGFVRLAADMCMHDASITASRNVGSVGDAVRTYLHNRFANSKERLVLEAIALMTKVGYSQDVSDELDILCSWLQLPARNETRDIARRLHDGPGFIGQSTRYFYVTPQIVAITFFEDAWNRWAAPDPDAFLGSMPTLFVERFVNQVSSSAPREVRGLVAAHFHEFIAKLSASELADLQTTDTLIKLIETEPDRYVPVLSRLIREATTDELRAITGTAVDGRWGPRRQLVWLTQRLVAFPEYFADAEYILYRLAIAENEPRIGNNATESWKQLFRIALSGTALTFTDRLKVLQDHLRSGDAVEIELGSAAINEIFSRNATRMVTSSVVGGKIPPAEWLPTRSQYRSSLLDTITLIAQLSRGQDHDVARQLRLVVIEHTRSILAMGLLDALKDTLDTEKLTDGERSKLLSEMDEFLQLDCNAEISKLQPSPEYVASVQSWYQSLQPGDLHGRLVALIGTKQWFYRNPDREAAWKSDVTAMGKELSSATLIEGELPWLLSSEAVNAYDLGKAIANNDPSGSLFDNLVAAVTDTSSTLLIRGYVSELLTGAEALVNRINSVIDDLENTRPTLAFDLFIQDANATNGLERLLRLIDSQSLPFRYVQAFRYGISGQPLTSYQFDALFTRLMDAAENGDRDAMTEAIELVAANLRGDENRLPQAIANAQSVSRIWDLLRLTALRGSDSIRSYWWAEIIKAMSVLDAAQAIDIAVAGIMDGDVTFDHQATELLSILAQQAPKEVMDILGEALLDDTKTWRFYIGAHRPIIDALPPDVVIEWIKLHGREAAHRIVRHIRPPYLDGDKPIVPELASYILGEFEDDERVFHEFVAGIHNMQMYEGDIAGQHEREAEIARKFQNHPLKRIREWAVMEERQSLEEAKRWRQHEEEMDLP